MIPIVIKKLTPTAQIPKYATEGSAAFDLVVDTFKTAFNVNTHINSGVVVNPKLEEITLTHGSRILIGTGLAMQIPPAYELQVRSRSGLALNKGLIVANSPGTIDSDYRGEVMVILLNTCHYSVTIKIGDRIAQAVLAPVEHAGFEEAEELTETARGEGGFGHTGA